jgi:hypothetical protein
MLTPIVVALFGVILVIEVASMLRRGQRLGRVRLRPKLAPEARLDAAPSDLSLARIAWTSVRPRCSMFAWE